VDLLVCGVVLILFTHRLAIMEGFTILMVLVLEMDSEITGQIDGIVLMTIMETILTKEINETIDLP
jgi:hypothetical protein